MELGHHVRRTDGACSSRSLELPTLRLFPAPAHEEVVSNTFSTAPMDVPACVPDFRKMVDRFDIPSAFVSERLRSVTHSFGARKLEDGSESTLPIQYISKKLPVHNHLRGGSSPMDSFPWSSPIATHLSMG